MRDMDMWGRQSWRQPSFRRLDPLESWSAGKIACLIQTRRVHQWLCAFVLLQAAAVVGFAQNGWGAWQPLNDSIDIRFNITKFDYGNAQHAIYWQVRNRYPYPVRVDYLLSFDKDDRVKEASETDTLRPGQQSFSGGSWTIGRSVTGFKILRVVNTAGADPGARQPGARQTFARPAITGVELDAHSIQLLKSASEKLELAGTGKKLLAWSPLLTLAGESNAVHAAVSISQTNWVELGESFSKIDTLVYYSLATEARTYANSDELIGNPKLKQFWNAMADFYQSQAAR